MKSIFILQRLIFILALLFTAITISSAQNGAYDIRLKLHSIDVTNMNLEVDIEVRAETPGTIFNISDQNYRLTYDPTVLANPTKVQELTLSGFVTTIGPASSSLYNPPHTLNGSVGDVISYNVELAGGDGFPLNDTVYVAVGRIALDILDLSAGIDLTINTKDLNDFPPTFVGERYNDSLYVASEGSYGNYQQSTIEALNDSPPSVQDDDDVTNEATAIIIDVLANDSDDSGVLDTTSLVINSVLPSSEGVVNILADGSIEFIPAPGFIGTSTIVYQICDEGSSVPASHGDMNLDMPSDPVPAVEYVQVVLPNCETATITVEVLAAAGAEFVVKAFMEGAYASPDIMTTVLNTSGLIPLAQPYNTAPWNYSGIETLASVPTNMTDWVLVTVRTAESNAAVVSSVAGIMLNDGQIIGANGANLQFADDISVYDSLYIAVYHRNHVGIMSATKVEKVSGVFTYDFTDASSKAFGDLTGIIELEPSVFGMIGGDYNGNGQVQNSDFNSLSPNLGLPGYRLGDLNLNGQVQNSDIQDFQLPNLGRGALFSY